MKSLGFPSTLVRSFPRPTTGVVVVVASPLVAWTTARLLRRALSWFATTDTGRYWISRVASRFSTKLDPGTRCDFVHLYSQSSFSIPQSHSHGTVATWRNEALRSMQGFASKSGFEPYSISASTRESDAGYHSWWLAKDVAHEPRWKPVRPHHMLLFCDVDYYCDMAKWLSQGNPAVIYTFSPTSVVGTAPGLAYTINTKSEVNVAVTGGAHYSHKIWDYDTDTLVIDYWTYSLVYSVEFRQLPGYHRVVLLTPLMRLPAPFGWVLPGKRFGRKCYSDGWALANVYQTVDTVMASVARFGAARSVDLPLGELQAIAIRFRSSKKPQIWDIETFLRKCGHEAQAPEMAAFLFDYLQTSLPSFLAWTSVVAPPVEREVSRPVNYVAYSDTDAPIKEIGRNISAQLVRHPDVVPSVAEANDMASVVGRIYEVVSPVVPPNWYDRAAQEFVRRLVPEPGVCVPWDASQVRDLWYLPLQRARVEKAENWMYFDPNVTIRAFMKHESYQNMTDPRNISTFPAGHNLELARYMYAFKFTLLKKLSWYLPGKTPPEIARCVAGYCSTLERICETDFSRFDGTKTEWIRIHVERAAYTRAFQGESRRQIGLLLDAERKAKAYTSTGMAYDPQGTQGSGSSTTTDTNTQDNAFVDFCALALTGLSWDEAWDRILGKGGDDGHSCAPRKALEEAASSMGFRLKAVEKFSRRNDPVVILARVFPRAWHGDPGSHPDMLRALRKIHISFAPPDVSDLQALKNKATGYRAADPQGSGVLGLWCDNVLRRHGRGSITVYDSPYYVWSNVDVETGEIATWPQSTNELANEYLASQLGNAASVAALEAWLEVGGEVDVPEELRLPNDPPEEKIPVIVTQSVWSTLPPWAQRFTRWKRDEPARGDARSVQPSITRSERSARSQATTARSRRPENQRMPVTRGRARNQRRAARARN